MKNIQPISIWDNGTNQEATILNACCVSDNLKSYASFFYTLLGDSMQQIAQGNLSMSNEDYIDWQTNDYAYDWIATKLNLTITGEYVPPVSEPIVEVEPDNNLE
jgi:hypothetical protein